MQYNNGLKFSFCLRQQAFPSSHSTPKFPSIELEKSILEKQRRSALQNTSVPITPASTLNDRSQFQDAKSSPSRPQSKGKRILEKYSHLTLHTHKERFEKDGKSVRSVQSNKSHKYQRNRTEKTDVAHSLSKTAKNRHSSLSSAHFRVQSVTPSPQYRPRSQQKQKARPQSPMLQPYRILFDERSAGRLITNNYVELLKATKRRPEGVVAVRREQGERGKSFKSFLHRPRPLLKIGPRMLSNRRLEEMSQPRKGEEDFAEF